MYFRRRQRYDDEIYLAYLPQMVVAGQYFLHARLHYFTCIQHSKIRMYVLYKLEYGLERRGERGEVLFVFSLNSVTRRRAKDFARVGTY